MENLNDLSEVTELTTVVTYPVEELQTIISQNQDLIDASFYDQNISVGVGVSLVAVLGLLCGILMIILFRKW